MRIIPVSIKRQSNTTAWSDSGVTVDYTALFSEWDRKKDIYLHKVTWNNFVQGSLKDQWVNNYTGAGQLIGVNKNYDSIELMMTDSELNIPVDIVTGGTVSIFWKQFMVNGTIGNPNQLRTDVCFWFASYQDLKRNY